MKNLMQKQMNNCQVKSMICAQAIIFIDVCWIRKYKFKQLKPLLDSCL